MNKRIVILGAGESGTGAAVLAKIKGFEVFVSDFGKIEDQYKEILQKYNIDFEEKQHTESLILNADEIIKSPGIPDKAPIVKKIHELNIHIISEIEFGARYTNAIKICITGSNGKTTTTTLIYELLKKAGLNVALSGNIGKSFAFQVATENYDYYVIELSSFQLDNMYEFQSEFAILLNITPDHLDRYDYKFQNYINSKFRILQNMTENDCFIYCSDDEMIIEELKNRYSKAKFFEITQKKQNVANGAFLNNNKEINYSINNKIDLTMSINDLALKGKHNVYNSMAAGIVAKAINIKNEFIREVFTDFKNIEHRLEPVISVCGIKFINDSKATNINSTWYALESVSGKIVWIVGGVDKGNDYSELANLVKEKVKAIVCLGIDNTAIHAAFEGMVDKIVDTQSMEDAVIASYKLAKDSDTVLLSPACASFDLFDNYEDRGRQFKMQVRRL
ncbi:MAG: UDP-N-acetylmuramoyl-L-alanine--D-glutamate ligase [Bacteroidales bacterium]|jgi:UDP-N-acetylmuramoylalanine--D-glutamate ligase|nr:UDP-N-acetylmuramoyl-L-alanine--D-glutamate ligase [Bacteroidales bacterium]